jgi:MFS family permease
MSLPYSAIFSLLAGVALLTAGNGLLSTLVSVRMAVEGFPAPVAGLVMSAYFGGFILGSMHASRIIDRVGHIRAFAAFAATLGVAATLQALVIAALPWVLLRGTVGFAMAGQLMVAESWLNAKAPPAARGQVFSRYVITVYLAFGSGQFLLAAGDPATLELFVLVAFLLSASILPIVLTQATAPILPPAPRLRLREIWARAPLGLTGAFAAGVVVGGIQSIGPQFAGLLGLPVAQISQFMGAFFLSGILLQWPVGRWSDRTDRRRVLATMAAAGAIVCVGIALVAERSFAALLLLAVAGGGTLATLYPLSVAHANDRLHDESVVAITATLLLAYGVGASAGPILATTAMTVVGAAGLFYIAAVPCVGLAGYAMFRIYAYAPVEQVRFEPIAQTTPVVLELDPRARGPFEGRTPDDTGGSGPRGG